MTTTGSLCPQIYEVTVEFAQLLHPGSHFGKVGSNGGSGGGGASTFEGLSDVDFKLDENAGKLVAVNEDGDKLVAVDVPSGGGGDNSYWIDAWIRTPKGATVSSTPFTSPGTWNNNKSAPAFTAKPTENIANGSVFDISDLPANAANTTAFDFHHFQRIFTVGETNVPNNAWKYIGLYTHSAAEPDTYLIHAYLRLTGTDTPTATSLSSAGTWDDATKSFSTEPTHGTLGDVFDQSNLPSDAFSSTTHGYWEYERYFTVGETGVAASAWTLKGRIEPCRLQQVAVADCLLVTQSNTAQRLIDVAGD